MTWGRTCWRSKCCGCWVARGLQKGLICACCDLPEVQTISDVLWVRDHLFLGETDEQAEKHFLDLVEESLHTVSTQLMDLIHIMAN